MLEFIYKDYDILPVFYIGMAIIRGSLGKYGPGRLVPNTVYKWLREITLEYERFIKHEKYSNQNYLDIMDLHKYPVGQAICKKIDWLKNGVINDEDWDKIPLKDLSERIVNHMDSVPELFRVESKNKKQTI
jgi:uncharacterized protein YfkK (UPF0435 family)